MKKSRIISTILTFVIILSLFASTAQAEPAPNLSSVKIYGITSYSSTGSPISETFSSLVIAPSTTLQHYKNEVRITITQMGYDKGHTAKLGSMNPNSESYVYLNSLGLPVSAGQIVAGYRRTFIFNNVQASGSSSLFQYTATNINTPYNTISATLTVNWTGSGTPTTPSALGFNYDYVGYQGKAVMTGITPGMQYKLTTSSGAWTTYNGGYVVANVTTSTYSYSVRQGTDNSTTQLVYVKPKITTPLFTYNALNEIVTINENNVMADWNATGVYYTPTVKGTSYTVGGILSSIGDPYWTLYFRVPATEEEPGSDIQTLRLYRRRNEPSTITYTAETATFANITADMEYSVDAAGAGWTTYKYFNGSGAFTFSGSSTDYPRKVRIRYAATSTTSASLPRTYTLPTTYGTTLWTTTQGSITIKNPDADILYRVSGTSEWLTMPTGDNRFNLANNDMMTIDLKRLANTARPSGSIVVSRTLKGAPVVSYDQSTHIISNIPSGCDISINSNGWVDITASSFDLTPYLSETAPTKAWLKWKTTNNTLSACAYFNIPATSESASSMRIFGNVASEEAVTMVEDNGTIVSANPEAEEVIVSDLQLIPNNSIEPIIEGAQQ